ncbi:MAG: hypothetical protein LW865_02150 [Betaproteobacteria bacterium]|jgi:hypothetical protein|nr:hypothetical protein [Betaproteobacteria bacterium]
MGATVLTGKRAEAFIANDGTCLYLLHEATYEKNCYPHTPHWGAMAFGTYDEVFSRIMFSASAAEGGMFQNTHGHMRPENYIADWRRHLAKPYQPLHGKACFDGRSLEYRRDRNTKTLTGFFEDLEQAGLSAWRERLENCDKESVYIEINEDHALLRFLVKRCPTWSLFSSGQKWLTDPMPNPPPLPTAKGIAVLPNISAYRCGRENCVVSIDGKTFTLWGWDYSAVAKYCGDYIATAELIQPGISKTAIPAFRNMLKAAPTLPDEAIVTVFPNRFSPDRGAESIGYLRQLHDELVAKLSLKPEVNQQERWQTTVADLKRAERAFWNLFSLDPNQVEYHVPPSTTVSSESPSELEAA